MRRSSLWAARALLPCLLALAACACAAQSATDAQALIQKAIKAYGGADALKASEEQGVMEGEVEVLIPFPNKMHVNIFRKGERTLLRFNIGPVDGKLYMDKQGGWKQILGTVSPLSPEELEQERLSDRHSPALLLSSQEADAHLEYLGKTKLADGFLADTVRITDARGEKTDFHFDPQTSLIAGMSFRGKNLLRGVEEDHLFRLSDYRTISGVPINFDTRIYQNGKLAQHLTLSRVDLKAEIPESVFARPGTATNTSPSATIPFDFSSGEIIVTAKVNGETPAKFIVDTGAGISLLTRSAANKFGLKVSGSASLGGGGGAAQTQFAQLDSLQVGSVVARDVKVAVGDLGPLEALLGHGFSGLIGHNFLSQFQVTFDYAARQLTLAPASTPLPEGTAAQMDIVNTFPLVDASTQNKKFRMVLDTGAMFAILPARLAADLKFGKVREGAFGVGLDGRPVQLKTTRLPQLTVGGVTLPDAPISYAPPGGPSAALLSDFANGILGNSLLRRFKVTLDYGKQKVVFRPYPAGDPYPDEWIHPGIEVMQGDSGKALVMGLHPGSPAAQAGLRLMDQILSINGKPVKAMSSMALMNALRGKEHTTVQVTAMHAGKRRTYSLKRIRLL